MGTGHAVLPAPPVAPDYAQPHGNSQADDTQPGFSQRPYHWGAHHRTASRYDCCCYYYYYLLLSYLRVYCYCYYYCYNFTTTAISVNTAATTTDTTTNTTIIILRSATTTATTTTGITVLLLLLLLLQYNKTGCNVRHSEQPRVYRAAAAAISPAGKTALPLSVCTVRYLS